MFEFKVGRGYKSARGIEAKCLAVGITWCVFAESSRSKPYSILTNDAYMHYTEWHEPITANTIISEDMEYMGAPGEWLPVKGVISAVGATVSAASLWRMEDADSITIRYIGDPTSEFVYKPTIVREPITANTVVTKDMEVYLHGRWVRHRNWPFQNSLGYTIKGCSLVRHGLSSGDSLRIRYNNYPDSEFTYYKHDSEVEDTESKYEYQGVYIRQGCLMFGDDHYLDMAPRLPNFQGYIYEGEKTPRVEPVLYRNGKQISRKMTSNSEVVRPIAVIMGETE